MCAFAVSEIRGAHWYYRILEILLVLVNMRMTWRKKSIIFQSLSFVSVNLTRVLCYLFKKTKWCHLVLLMEACVHTGMDVERFAWMSEWEIKAETSVTGSMVLIIYIRWGHSLTANYLHQSYKLTGHFIRYTLMKWLILI